MMLSLSPAGGGKPIGISRNCDIVYLNSEPGNKKNTIDVANLQPLPSSGPQREVLYVCGPSGSGKSVFCKSYIKQWQVINPGKDVYIFSKIQGDESLAGIKDPAYIPVDQDLVDNPIELEEMRDSLCLFDDCDQIADKAINGAITNLMGRLLEHARHYNVTVIIVSHLINANDKGRTRTILNEASKIVLFHHALNHHSLKYFFTNYIGLTNKKTLDSLLELPSRFLLVHKNYPIYVLHSQGVIML